MTMAMATVVRSAQLLLAVALAFSGVVVASAAVSDDAFTATGRFEGFRYEIAGACPDLEALQEHIVLAADQLSCFGWVQRSPAGTVVGEARCNKEGAAYFKQYLQRGVAPFFTDDIRAAVHPYKDTNIKLHFSDFRRLDPSRRTCFDDLPHACSLYEKADSASAGGSAGTSREDL